MIFLKKDNNLFIKFNNAIVYDIENDYFCFAENKFYKNAIEIPLYEIALSNDYMKQAHKALIALENFDLFLFQTKINFITNERKEEIKTKTIIFLKNFLKEGEYNG